MQIRLFLFKNKWIIFAFFLLSSLSAIGWWLFNRQRTVVFAGEIEGHHYAITYVAKRGKNYQHAIDSVFTAVVSVLDSRLPGSVVTQFNDPNSDSLALSSHYLYDIITKAKRVYQQTYHVFDPTATPLVELWQQSLAQGRVPHMVDIQHTQQVVGLDYIVVNERRVKKLKEGVQINLDILVDSYAVDLLATFLQEQGIKQYCIKIDNSVCSAGYDATQAPEVPYIVSLDNASSLLTCYNQMANGASSMVSITYNQDGVPSPMVIDPRSGWIAAENPQAIIVFATDCTAAHAYAIAFQILGWDKVAAMLNTLQGVMACRIRMHDGEVVFDTMGDVDVRYQSDKGKVYFLDKEKNLSSQQSSDMK